MKSKFIILDRDGVIIKDKHYMHKIEEIEFLPKAINGLRKLQQYGYELIIITNQAGVARGYFTTEQAWKFNNEVVKRLKDNNVIIKKNYICPHHPGVSGECNCRKPKIGMAQEAAQEFGFDLKECVFIGDKDSDIEFGKNCEGKTILIKNNEYQNKVRANFEVNNTT